MSNKKGNKQNRFLWEGRKQKKKAKETIQDQVKKAN